MENTAKSMFRTFRAHTSMILCIAGLLLPIQALARWDVHHAPTQKTDIKEMRLFADNPSRILGYSALTRSIETRHGDIPVSVVTNTVLKKDAATDVSITAMAEGVRQVLKLAPWKREDIDGVSHFTVRWAKYHRLLHLAIRSDGDRWLISFSNTREPFVKIGAEETDLVQRAFFLIESESRKNGKTKNALLNLILPRAEAVTTIELINLLGRAGTSESANNVAGAIRDIGGNLGSAIQSGTGNVSDALRSAGGNAASAGRDVAGAGRDVLAASKQFDRTLSTKNAAKLGAVGGASFGIFSALGSTFTNMGLSGLSWGLREAFYAITGQMKSEDQQRLRARVEGALNSMVEKSDQLEALDGELAALGDAMASAMRQPALSVLENSEKRKTESDDMMSLLRGKLETEYVCEDVESLDPIHRLKQVMKTVTSKEPVGRFACERVEAMLENWKLAEAQLHRAKSIIISENETLMAAVRSNDVDALPDTTVSQRARVSECKETFERSISRYQELLNGTACSSSATADRTDSRSTADCKDAQIRIANLRTDMERCEINVARALAAQPVRSLAVSLEGLSNELAIYRKRFNGLLKSDCREGETTSPCDGRMGPLSVMRARYSEHVKKALAVCPDLNLVASNGESAGLGVARAPISEKVSAQAANSQTEGAQTRSPAADTATSTDGGTQATDSRGFFARILDALKSFFTGGKTASSNTSFSRTGDR